jgi:hypothetical protein
LKHYKKGRFEVYLDTSGFDKQAKYAGNLIRLLSVVVMLTGIIVGSAIATGIAAAFQVEQSSLFSTISFIGYIGASILAVVVIIVLLWQLLRPRPD